MLTKIINLIRMIWVNSKHYKSRERLTGLFRKVCVKLLLFKQLLFKLCTVNVYHTHTDPWKLNFGIVIMCYSLFCHVYCMDEILPFDLIATQLALCGGIQWLMCHHQSLHIATKDLKYARPLSLCAHDCSLYAGQLIHMLTPKSYFKIFFWGIAVYTPVGLYM